MTVSSMRASAVVKGRWYAAIRQELDRQHDVTAFRVPLLLVLAHAGMNPHWANLTTLVVLFGLRFWISDRFIWNSQADRRGCHR